MIFFVVKFFFSTFLSHHHKINSFKHPSFLSRHLFHCLIKSSDKASPAWRRTPSHCDLYIYCSLSLCKQPKTKSDENNKHAVHGIPMLHDWFLAFVFARTNEIMQHLILFWRNMYLFCCHATEWPLKQLANQVDCCKKLFSSSGKFPLSLPYHCLNWHNVLSNSLFSIIQSAEHIYVSWAIFW